MRADGGTSGGSCYVAGATGVSAVPGGAGGAATGAPGAAGTGSVVQFNIAPLPVVPPVLTPGPSSITINPQLPAGLTPAMVTNYSVTCTAPAPAAPATIPDPTALPYTASGLTPGATYTCTLVAHLADGRDTAPQSATAVPTAAPVAVPTMGEWGLLLMSLGVAGFAARRVRKGRAD